MTDTRFPLQLCLYTFPYKEHNLHHADALTSTESTLSIQPHGAAEDALMVKIPQGWQKRPPGVAKMPQG